MKKSIFCILIVCATVFASVKGGVSSLENKLAKRSGSEVQIVERVRELSSDSRAILIREQREIRNWQKKERLQEYFEMMRENKMKYLPKPNMGLRLKPVTSE